MTHPHEALTKMPNPVLAEPKPINDLGFGAPCTDGLSPHTKFETRLEATLRESKAKARQIEADMIAADAKGELWTVQAALKPGRVFCLIYHGRHDDTEPLESQHRGDAIFGPLHLMGTHREVQAEALKLFTVDEITIRTIR